MKQLRLPIFTSKIKIYNLRIVPPSAVFNDVLDFKRQFENEFGKQPLSGSKPHITLATFRMNSKYQDVLTQVFEQLAQVEKFKLAISGFDVFEKSSNALHLNVRKTENMARLHQVIQSLCDEGLGRKIRSLSISTIPHMTISKTKGKKMLYQSLAHFQKIGYSKTIEVGHLTLVSRSKYRAWDWEHHIVLSKI